MKRVLIMCTGNSCRSQMAEAMINKRIPSTWQAFSAGTEPSGYVHPIALMVLEEVGITHLGVSKHIDNLPSKEFDLVITVCDDAAEKCPAWLGQGNRVHFGFPDPAKAVGTQEEVLAVFRKVLQSIDQEILGYLKNI